MSNETNDPFVPADPRARAFLKQYPNAKLDGFDMVPASSLVDPRIIQPKLDPEPEKSKRTEGTVTADKLAVIIAVDDEVYQFALSQEQREFLLGVISKLHGGTPHLFSEPIQNMNIADL